MATELEKTALLARLRMMSDADLSVLHAACGEPDSRMMTVAGSANHALWTELARLGWMADVTGELPSLPAPVAARCFALTEAGRAEIAALLRER